VNALLARLLSLFHTKGQFPKMANARKRQQVELTADTSYVSLDCAEYDLEELPNGISVQFSLSLRGCRRLKKLPLGLQVGSLDASQCLHLEGLPEGLKANFVDISDCPQIESWPASASISVGRLRARNCTGLTILPDWLGPLSQLDLAGCTGISHLPASLEVSSWIDIAGTRISELPEQLTGVGLRWRGVTIDNRIAFRAHEITAREVLEEKNAELRRVKMERMTLERFLTEANPALLDQDTDRGGQRKLYRVNLDNDEPLVCVSVICPSTGRSYFVRVPPDTKSCQQAVAWTAGFDNPNDYQPRIET
jgi:hypothetical protein